MHSGPIGVAVRPWELFLERSEEIAERPCQYNVVVAVQPEHNYQRRQTDALLVHENRHAMEHYFKSN